MDQVIDLKDCRLHCATGASHKLCRFCRNACSSCYLGPSCPALWSSKNDQASYTWVDTSNPICKLRFYNSLHQCHRSVFLFRCLVHRRKEYLTPRWNQLGHLFSHQPYLSAPRLNSCLSLALYSQWCDTVNLSYDEGCTKYLLAWMGSNELLLKDNWSMKFSPNEAWSLSMLDIN